MNTLHIMENEVKIEIKGFDKVLALRGSITIPKSSISKVYKYEGTLKPGNAIIDEKGGQLISEDKMVTLTFVLYPA